MSAFAPPSGELEKELLDVERKRCEAICKSDLNILQVMMSDTLTYVHIHGNIEHKKDYLDGLAGLREFKSVEREDLKIQVLGDVAIMTGVQKVMVRRLDVEGSDYREIVVFATQVWARTNGEWQMEIYQSTKL